jgi:hypothetical protein
MFVITIEEQEDLEGDQGDESALKSENEDDDLPTVRRSNRRSNPRSRFVNTIMLGLQLGRFIKTDTSWNNLIPLKPLPERVYLEQDVSQSSFLSRPEIRKLKELSYLDRLNEEWDPSPRSKRYYDIVTLEMCEEYVERILMDRTDHW